MGAAKVVAGWALIVTVLVLIMVGFGGPSMPFRAYMYGSGALLMFVTALLIMFPRHSAQDVRHAGLPSGAPAAATGLVCIILVLASAYSFWIGFLALAPGGFVVARTYGEYRERRRRRH